MGFLQPATGGAAAPLEIEDDGGTTLLSALTKAAGRATPGTRTGPSTRTAPGTPR